MGCSWFGLFYCAPNTHFLTYNVVYNKFQNHIVGAMLSKVSLKFKFVQSARNEQCQNSLITNDTSKF